MNDPTEIDKLAKSIADKLRFKVGDEVVFRSRIGTITDIRSAAYGIRFHDGKPGVGCCRYFDYELEPVP